MANLAKKILLIEDEQFIADIYSRELTKAGFEVKVAVDGPSGLKALEDDVYDLLLLDVMLPGMHGLEVLRQFKLKNPQSTMLVVLLTNLGHEEVIKEAFSLGAQGYLIKASYTPKQVVNEVTNVLAGKQSSSPPPTPTT